ncbi:hypothetical protein [Acinetobacter sp. YH12052]|uniref:hypothetical protein n=1 Tax=Acinetobacter sp. YH12052 TaxID=2601055 RepID=UPI0015D2F503|nr:hypothetical protein [Acinetobacter sp. YH12052]
MNIQRHVGQRTIIKTLLKYRWIFYVKTTADAVARQKHLLILVTLILGPMLFGLLLSLVQPIIDLVYCKSLITNLFLWTGFLALNVFWCAIQRKALSGGEGYRYLALLPITLKSRFAVEIKFLGSLSFLMLLPFVLALLYVWVEYELLASIGISVLMLLWIFNLLIIQMLLLQQNQYWVLVCLLTYLPILSLAILEAQLVAVLLSTFICIAAIKFWLLGRKSKPIKLQVPSVFVIQKYSPLWLNQNKLIIRQAFHKRFLTHRIVSIGISVTAVVILYWFATQVDTWNIMSLDFTASQLFQLMCAVYIALSLFNLGVIKMDLKSNFESAEQFWIIQGFTRWQLRKYEYCFLLIIGLMMSVPVLLWLLLKGGLVDVLLMVTLFGIAIPFIQWLYRKPEEVHGVMPVLMFILWVPLAYCMLSVR